MLFDVSVFIAIRMCDGLSVDDVYDEFDDTVKFCWFSAVSNVLLLM